MNRVIYPVVLLKTRDQVEKFMDTNTEWVENTPFYRQRFVGFGDYFRQFRKVTRVIAFISSKSDFEDEQKLLSEAGVELALREDLRIAKITNPNIVKEYKKLYNFKWFSEVSSNSIVMFKKDRNKSENIVKFYDLNTETNIPKNWISENSIENLEELSGSTFKIITLLRRSIFIAFLNRTHSEYGEESLQLYNILEKIGGNYPGFAFTYTEEDRYRENKNSKHKIRLYF